MTPKTAARYVWHLAPTGGYVLCAVLGVPELRPLEPYREEAKPFEHALHEHEGERGEFPVESYRAVMAIGATGGAGGWTLGQFDTPLEKMPRVTGAGPTGMTGPTGATGQGPMGPTGMTGPMGPGRV